MKPLLRKHTASRQAAFLLFAACSLAVAGCRGTDPNAAGGVMTVAGSTSIQPFAEKLAEEFMAEHAEYNINIQGGGSSAGVRAAQTGAAQIGMSSRNLKDKEKGLHERIIAYDGIAVIVHRDNPLQGLSKKEVAGIFAGDYDNWKDLGGSDGSIHFVAREEGSGTRGAFEKMVMEDREISLRALVQASNGAVREIIARDPGSIGYISLGLVDYRVTALSVDGARATRQDIMAGRYKLVRPFLFLTQKEPEGTAGKFIDFIMGPQGQELLSAEGLIPGE